MRNAPKPGSWQLVWATSKPDFSMEQHDAKALRNALGHFPTGVTVVTTCNKAGKAVGVTINSFGSLSLDPPLILWSLATKAYSYPAFAKAKNFAVHVLAADQQNLAEHFARTAKDKFDGIGFSMGMGNVPLLSGCAAIFQCATQRRVAGGDHVILIGHVEKFIVTADRLPLVFHRGRYVIPEPGSLFSSVPALSTTD